MRMVTDHTKANDELTSLSQQLGDPAPTQTDSKHKAMTAALQKASGSSFDTLYLKQQLLGHEKTIALFKKEISSGSNPALKSFAQTTLPVLEEHLTMIKTAQQA
jgi:putative membrane protein